MSNALESIAHEVSLLPNLPIFGIGAQLTQMQQQMQQMQQQLATIQRDITRKYVVPALQECQFSNM